MLAVIASFVACSSPAPIDATMGALEARGVETGLPDLPDTATFDTSGPDNDTSPVDTPTESVPLLELSFHLMLLGGLDLVDMHGVVDAGTTFLTRDIEGCAEEAPAYEDLVWLDFEDCERTAGWGWVVNYASCTAPGESLYSGALAFTFPPFADVDETADPTALEEAKTRTADRGYDAAAQFYYSTDSGSGTVMTACGTATGRPVRREVSAQIALDEPDNFTMAGTLDGLVNLKAKGRRYDVTRTGSLVLAAESADGSESFEGRVSVTGLTHRTDSGYPSAGRVAYLDSDGAAVDYVRFERSTGRTGQAVYVDPDEAEVTANFLDLHQL